MPKSKADKRKSLLGNAKDSSDDEKVSEVSSFVCCLPNTYIGSACSF